MSGEEVGVFVREGMVLNERCQRREQTENGASGGFNASGIGGERREEEERRNGQIIPQPEGRRA